MTENSPTDFALDPQLREKLLKESKNPFKGLLRVVWIALFGSSFIGLFVMSLRSISGHLVPLSDAAIQICAFLFFGFLVFFRRENHD